MRDVADGSTLRTRWLAGTIVLSIAPIVAAIVLAPSADASPSMALVWLLFIGSSVHVGATAWFYTIADVRRFMRGHRWRYVWSPLALVAGAAAVSASVSFETMEWLLLAFFAWQFFHFQKQNLGIAALAARSAGASRLTRLERAALVTAGLGGIAALVAHPALLQLGVPIPISYQGVADALFKTGAVVFVVALVLGSAAVLRRRSADRPRSFLIVYAISLFFFMPVFWFDSPYAAVAGLTIAHGMQYLLLMGLIAGTPIGVAPARIGILIFMNLAMVVGLGLNQAAHLHGSASTPGRLLFGVFLGVSMAHFVVDAGLWRLRDEFPRSFLTRRLPYLLAP